MNTSDNTQATNKQRLVDVKTWMETELGDMFECEQVTDGTTEYLYMYFKDTPFGLYIAQTTSGATSANDTAGYFTQGKTRLSAPVTQTKLNRGNVNLLLIRSRHGYIAGLYKDTVSNNVKALCIDTGSGYVPIIMHTANAVYIYNNGQQSFQLTQSAQLEDAALLKFIPPYGSCIPEGIYRNVGSSTTNCIIFAIGEGAARYAELQGIEGYETLTLKLEE